jgi:transglutaminase-like putative cysteine protease
VLSLPRKYDGWLPARAVADWLAGIFTYTPDAQRDFGIADSWPPRSQIEGELAGTGRIEGDCDDHAFAAVYALADLGVKARVVLCWAETGAYHAVAEDETGYVIDNRFPGMPHTWAELLHTGYRRDRMSGFFEFGELAQWTYVAA